ncbi:class I SAM-dependent methyltransferase [Sphingomonas sp.]|jgi:SAM-dependent methyltransferase|uniref:class I SAM-dependent methyltransferase n=1 Tax=Sphingomonas sp. TaxID=28214 RepID=UPI002E31E9AF|nr:methyltransferase domain-containing protein [Sphingomonas sp.]HEX4694498.1 methyltransferase domain-containing protein [Sphingomonas sp.]
MSAPVNPIAGTGFARGAGVYATSRPGYPPEAADWLRDRLGIAPGSIVAEVGAGTGKFTETLVAAGADVIAIDPVGEMLEQLRAALPGVRTIVAPAQALPLADESVDAVVCATAFHWFASDAVVAEFRRVLRPGGALGLIWNTRDTSVDWVAELSAITNRHQGDAPRETAAAWRAPFPAPGFTPLHETLMRYAHRGAAEDVVVGRTLSTSFIAALPPATQADVAAEVRALIARTPELAGESVTFPYVTMAYDCRRID